MTTLHRKGFYQDITLFGVLVMIDLWTKYWFFNKQRWADTFFLEPAMNTGISFSMDMSLPLVIIMTVIAIGLFGFMYIKKLFPRLAIIFLFAWTLGNLYDRVVYDGVRDFIVIPEWFICNVADVFLSLWMCLAILSMIIEKRKN